MSGVFAPGASITTRSLAESLQISGSPVRDALKRLEADSALESRNKSAYFLPLLSKKDYAEVLAIRVRLEGYAAREAASIISESQIREIEEFNNMYRNSNNVRDELLANFQFHLAIYKSIGSSVLVDTIENMWMRIGPTLHVDTLFGDGRPVVKNHERIIEALRHRDGAAAERALVRDLTEAAEVIMPRLSKGRSGADEGDPPRPERDAGPHPNRAIRAEG